MVLLCIWTGAAAAGRPARSAELKALAASVRDYVRVSGCCAANTKLRVISGSVSTVNRDFATVSIPVKDSRGSAGPRATVVLVHTYSGRWTVIALGTARLACGVSPAIRRDLRLPACR